MLNSHPKKSFGKFTLDEWQRSKVLRCFKNFRVIPAREKGKAFEQGSWNIRDWKLNVMPSILH